MRDLTKGPLSGHIIAMATPMAVGMLVQTLYYLVDLYFVAQIGDVALAGVSAAGNVFFLVMALTQVLAVGTVTLISHAVGAKQQAEANLIFNQSMVFAASLTTLTVIGGYSLAEWYLGLIAADAATVAAGMSYLYWFLPGMALQFAIVAMGSALRGTGIVKPTMVVQLITVVVNIILAPVLIAGWGTGHPFGVAGAGMATTLAVLIGTLLMVAYFCKLEHYVQFDLKLWAPRFRVWRSMLAVGLPAGGEFALMFLYMAVIYAVVADFGASAQAGVGIGMRMMQAIFLPAMAVAFSAPAVAGQNYGARNAARVRSTFTTAALMNTALMIPITLLCKLRPEWLVSGFSSDPEVLAVAVVFLSVISWNFVASGLVFTCSGMFQALGNTLPALASTATRMLTFVGPAIWMSQQTWFEIVHVWYLSVATVSLQAVLSVLLLYWQFDKRLEFDEPAATSPTAL
jgi:MATE family, multidrug efflux pump